MRLLHCTTLLGWVCLAGLATADTGVTLDSAGGYWFGAQTRLRLQAVPVVVQPLRLGYGAEAGLSGYSPVAASLTGDYYFSPALVDPALPRTGFRASGALLIRQPGVSLADLAWASRAASTFGVPARLSLPSLSPELADVQNYSVTALPYFGIGYSDVSLKTGWGFWADVGLVVQSPGNALGMGRVLSGTQGVDDLLRELRMSPMVQLGVNYSF